MKELARRLRRRINEALAVWPVAISAHWNSRPGVTDAKRQPELIVSLTSIPERLATLHLCLDGLLRQTVKPDRLILWLSETFEPNRPELSKESLLTSLSRLQKRGLEIRWCKDIGSFRKIIPTLKAHPGAVVVTADDDVYYPPNWLEQLYTAYQAEPQFVHCHRAHRMRYEESGRILAYRRWIFESPGFQGPSRDLFPTGDGGILYAPNHLNCETLNEKAFLDLCPKADDVWLKAMSLLNQVQVKKVAPNSIGLREIRIRNNRRLEDYNLAGGQNDIQIEAVNRAYSCFGQT